MAGPTRKGHPTQRFLSGMTSPPRLRFSPRSRGQRPELSAGKTQLFATRAGDLVTLVSKLAEATVIVSERLRDQRERPPTSQRWDDLIIKKNEATIIEILKAPKSTRCLMKVHNENHNEGLSGPHWVMRGNQIIIHKTGK